MDGLPALWDTVIDVLRSTTNTVKPNHDGTRGNVCKAQSQTTTPNDKRKQKVEKLSDVDYEPTNTHSS